MSSSSKQKCKYWDKCFRQNPDHFDKYLHPLQQTYKQVTPKSYVPVAPKPNPVKKPDVPKLLTDTSGSVKRLPEEVPSVSRKRRKLSETIRHDRYYFTKVVGHPAKFSDGIAVSFRDILSLDGKLLKSWQFTYMADLDWLLAEYPETAAEGPIFLFTGESHAQDLQHQILSNRKCHLSPTKYSRLAVVPVVLPLAYGTHHTKLMVLLSGGGVRVVIHTANLVLGDWTVKTQGVWISPLCPEATGGDDGGCEFKSYLINYLQSYATVASDQLCMTLRHYDFSQITGVKLVGSRPGLHDHHLYGLLRLQKLLAQSVDHEVVRPGWRVCVNCSSIGTLGQRAGDWLEGFIRVLQTTNKTVPSQTSQAQASLANKTVPSQTSQAPASLANKTVPSQPSSPRTGLFQLVFPTVEMIRNSLEGYCGGGSVPYSLQTHRRQPWLLSTMCCWDSRQYGRSRVVPHIKTYTRLSPDCRRAAWVLLSSANLSKAAWGQVLGDGRVRIRSYELGVLFIGPGPQDVHNPATDSGIIVPYSLPPKPYSGKEDKPWLVDVVYFKLDTQGNQWPIRE